MKTIKLGGKEYKVRFRERARLVYEAEFGHPITKDWEAIYNDLTEGMFGRILHIIYIMLTARKCNEPLTEDEFLDAIDDMTDEEMGELIGTCVEAMIEDLFPKDKVLEDEAKEKHKGESEEGQEKKGEA